MSLFVPGDTAEAEASSSRGQRLTDSPVSPVSSRSPVSTASDTSARAHARLREKLHKRVAEPGGSGSQNGGGGGGAGGSAFDRVGGGVVAPVALRAGTGADRGSHATAVTARQKLKAKLAERLGAGGGAGPGGGATGGRRKARIGTGAGDAKPRYSRTRS